MIKCDLILNYSKSYKIPLRYVGIANRYDQVMFALPISYCVIDMNEGKQLGCISQLDIIENRFICVSLLHKPSLSKCSKVRNNDSRIERNG